MKPRIDFSYEDITWVKPVSDDIRKEIEKCFQDNPKHKQKFDKAEIKLLPMITNCWLELPEEKENDFFYINIFFEKLKKVFAEDSR